MRVPTEYKNYKHEALLCFWEPLHHKGELEAFFEVDVLNESFKKLKVFSMSNYVSMLLKTTETIEVEMSATDARIAWLNKLYIWLINPVYEISVVTNKLDIIEEGI